MVHADFFSQEPRTKSSLGLVVLLSALLFCGFFAPPARAATATTTTLAVTPSNSIAAQQIATLTASVQAGGAAVTVGTVNFFDGKLYLGSVQVVRNASHGYAVGTATWKLALSVGIHSIAATFLPTATLASSTSASQTVTVSPSGATGPGTTNLILSNSHPKTGDNNNLLTATLSASGADKPTGSIVFSNQTSNTALGTVVVNPSSFVAGFAPVASVSAVFPQQIYSADFNGDGLPDFLAMVGDTTPTEVLQPYLNVGDGTFRTLAPIVTPLPSSSTAPLSSEAEPSPILGTDFNGDGVPDLAFQSSATTISVLLGAGDGTFPFTETLSPPSGGSTSYFESVAIGDFNGDGIPDLMATNVVYTSAGGSIVVNIFPGKGDGTFGSPITSTSVDGFSALVQDFNQDGFADLAIVPSEQKVLLIQLGNGDGTFQPAVSYPVGTAPMLGTALQSRGNGIAELAVWNTGDSTVGILLGKGDGTFLPQVTYPYNVPDPALNQAIAADVTGDGLQDIVVLNYPVPQEPPSPQTFSVFAGNGDGTYQAPVTYNFLPNTLLTQPFSLTTGDFNHDGVADIGVSDAGNGLIEALSLSSQGNPLYSARFPLTTTVYGVSIQQVVANYSGDSNNSAAVSNLVAVPGSANPKFNLNPDTTSLTIAAGQTGTVTIGVIPLNGFAGTVQFSCSGLPANSTCSFSPSSVTPNGVATNTTLTVATNVQAAANRLPANGLRGSFVSFAILMGFGSLAGIRRSGKGVGGCSSARRCWQWLFFAATFALAVGSPLGCSSGSGSGSGSSSGGGGGEPSTPGGLSTVTVTAVSSGPMPLTLTFQFNLIITT
jgi:FG-GAP-like repeat/Bacterial Ig-like domain (group 3)